MDLLKGSDLLPWLSPVAAQPLASTKAEPREGDNLGRSSDPCKCFISYGISQPIRKKGGRHGACTVFHSTHVHTHRAGHAINERADELALAGTRGMRMCDLRRPSIYPSYRKPSSPSRYRARLALEEGGGGRGCASRGGEATVRVTEDRSRAKHPQCPPLGPNAHASSMFFDVFVVHTKDAMSRAMLSSRG